MSPESTFTAPSEFCPYPDRWYAPDTDATEDEVTKLVAAMVRAVHPDYVIETGTYLGHTALEIAEVLDEQGYGQLDTIEVDPARARLAAFKLRGYPEVKVVCGDSQTFTPRRPIDFAWFDSSFAARSVEYRRFLPFMHDRTVVGFHDTAPHHPLRPSLEALVAEGIMTPMFYLNTPRGVSFARPVLA